MLRDERSGRYVLRAGVICSALGWNLGTKLGKHLADIHAPIPDYKEKMAFSMDRYVCFSFFFFFSPFPSNPPIPFPVPKAKVEQKKEKKENGNMELSSRLERGKCFANVM